MAAGQQLLRMIRSAPTSDTTLSSRVEIEVTPFGLDAVWINIYEDEVISFGGTGDDLIFDPQVGNIEYTAPDDQGAPYSVSGIRIVLTGGLHTTFPETFFTPIEVEGGSTLRFTEIKLTLT